MEVFFFGLHPDLTEKRLSKYLAEKFRPFGINHFQCEKKRRGNSATAIILDAVNGERFLQAYTVQGGKLVLEKPFRCNRSRYAVDPIKLRCLEKKVIDQAKKTVKVGQGPPTVKQFVGSSISCGTWDYLGSNLTFLPQFMMVRPLRVYFGRKQLVIMVDRIQKSLGQSELRFDIDYSSIQSLTCADTRDSAITLTLYNSPKFYKIPPREGQSASEVDELTRLFRNTLGKSPRPGPSLRPPKRIRTSGLDHKHASVAGRCYVYQLKLSLDHVQAIRALLHRKTFLPDIANWPFRVTPVPQPGTTMTLDHLVRFLEHSCYNLEFAVKFQLQRLAQNSYLLPHIVLRLIPTVIDYHKKCGFEATVNALQQMSKEIPYAGPESEAKMFTVKALGCLLTEQNESNDIISPFTLVRRYSHLVLIHRARVTPTTIHLEGPCLETKNSVLDIYSQFALSHFLRVSFQDENGEPLKFENNVELTEIHGSVFKRILDSGIEIAGQTFKFLGFSHSSLREQACWFCAAFIKDGSLEFGQKLINKLGDFSAIRSPARCAARIGQAFTDLNDNVPLGRTSVIQVSDIERNGRCFSDGCSTASEAVFRKLWQNYKPGKAKPTLFQIRYGGVKGMISLDKRLRGEVLHVRPSQEKFPSDREMLGICGAARRPLPFYLNRPMIKILEDLGVPISTFMSLQTEAMAELKAIAHSPVNAATFIEIHDIAKSSNLAWLMRELYYMGVPVLEDHFLWSAVELVLIMRLRDLKYRGRIPVEDGATLFGVMDETGILAEGDVYCPLTNADIIKGRVTVTRSPVMHPGDIQYAQAVDVPADSPLKDLHNCIVFSQHGNRDLPSQLSGGDLDGDIFNVLADSRLHPPKTFPPADYPRPKPIDIQRLVETADITGFFIDFMSNDHLGRISNLHLQLADRLLRGTESSECLLLAEMHSTAVDFSKTGIPVSMEKCPRGGREKPDFMAPGPRIIVSDGIPTVETDDSRGLYHDNEDDVLDELDDSFKPQYYNSHKALGQLFRAVDEQKILADVQSGKRRGSSAERNALTAVLQYARKKTQGITWEHLRDWASDIKEQYENAVSDMMFANSLDPRKPLSEIEVFVGHIMGRDGGGGSSRAREMSRALREQFQELVEYTIECILKDENEEFTEEALERSLACLAVATETVTAARPRLGKLESFGYLAGTICLRQVKRFSKDGF